MPSLRRLLHRALVLGAPLLSTLLPQPVGSREIHAARPPVSLTPLPARTNDVFQEIDRRQQLEALEDAEAWQLRAQVWLEPERLPPDLAAFPMPQTRCMTPLLLELFQHRHLLDVQTRSRLMARAMQATPLPSVGSVSSSHYPITVHYRTVNQIDQAEYVLYLAETSWEQEIEELGFAAPLPDDGSGGSTNLDFYLATYEQTYGGAYTQPTYVDSSSNDSMQSCATYIALNERLPDDLMPVYVAHELNHASQAAMDFLEFSWAWEATATFVEDEVFDDINDYYWYIPYFQGYPEQNLVYFGSSEPYSIYPYGGSIFVHFLKEALGDDDERLVADLWERSSQAGRTNEPDFLDAVAERARSEGWQGIEEAYARFALWRYFVGSADDGAHFSEGAAWGGEADAQVPITRSIALEDLPATGSITDLAEFGTSYVMVNTGGEGEGRQIRIRLTETGDTRWSLVASRLYEGGRSSDVILIDAPENGKVSAAVTLEGADRILIGVLNVGQDDYDPDFKATTEGVSYELELEDAGTSSGCGCHTEGSASPPLEAGMLLIVLLLHARRQR